MKPKDLPKYVLILKRGGRTRYRYPLDDKAMGLMLDIAERSGEKLVKMWRCSYEKINV